MADNDELKIYRGNDYVINDKIIIHQPTLEEICDFGEEKYFSFISRFTSIPVDYIAQLEDAGIKYETMSDFDLFLLTSKSFTPEYSRLLFGDLDFSKLFMMKCEENQQIGLYESDNKEQGALPIIDKYIHTIMVDYIRKSHGLKRNNVKCGNTAMREYLIDESRERMLNINKFKSVLKPLISSMINTSEFKYGHNEVWNLKINAFMDSINRIQLIKNYEQTMQGIYAGTIDFKKNKSQLNWLRELD